MRLLNVGSLNFRQFNDRSIPSYVIASHRWFTGEGDGDREATFVDVEEGQNKHTKGFRKVLDFANYVKNHVDDVEWLWIDTCCINKQDAQEVTESINSMFRWYRDAAVCLAYLADVRTLDNNEFESSEWFKRGWTLQELLAPRVVVFLSQDWQVLGHKSSDTNEDTAAYLDTGPPLDATVAKITSIPEAVLRNFQRAKSLIVEEKLAWMRDRRTTKEEDMWYVLIGIFDAPIGANYGEGGDRARKRLLAEISRDDALLDKLPIAHGAAFDDRENELVSDCLPETRVALLQNIDSWAWSKDGARIFWLAGMAGTGKSTIFKTIARTFKDKSHLAATFCFKKGEAGRGNASRLITTICAQLARRLPEVRQSVVSILKQDPDVVRKSLREQFEKLIHRPLQHCQSSLLHRSAWIVGIDALDECDNEAEIGILLDLFAKLESLESVNVRIFVTSRPDLPVRLGFGRMSSDTHFDVRLEEITRQSVAHDIAVYLRHKLAEIRFAWANLNGFDALGQDWPGEDAVQALVEMAQPLFIFAATACRLLEEPDEDPEESLRTILKHRLEASQLDRTYRPVLERLLLNKTPKQQELIVTDFQIVVGAVLLLAEPLPVLALSKLLEVPEAKVVARLNRLHSVLDVPPAGDSCRAIRPLHLSFRDYLTDPGARERNPLWIDEAQTHKKLAWHCLRVLEQSRAICEDVCAVQEPGTRRVDVSKEHIADCIPVDVAYACSYWVLHTMKSGDTLCDNGPVHQFLQLHFLHWLEALSWLDRISWLVAFVGDLKSIAKIGESDTLLAFLEDARRFVLRNLYVIDLAPLQTYSSALLFTPTESLVRRHFEYNIPAWIMVRPQVVSNWSAELQAFEGHEDSVLTVAYSPNGKTIASGSRDRTVRIWSAITGVELHKLEGHDMPIRIVAYSPNGQTVASGSEDCIVRLWNAATGVEVHKLRGHDSTVTAVAYSPNGQNIASGSDDCTVRIWNAGTGVEMHQIKGHTDKVWSVAYHPDGQTVASGSSDRTMRVWDAATGLEVHRFKGFNDAVCAIAFSSDGRSIACVSDDGIVRAWNIETCLEVRGPIALHDVVNGVAFLQGGQMLVVSAALGHYYWNLETGALEQAKHAIAVSATSLAPDGETMALAGTDHSVHLCAWASEEAQILPGHGGDVTSVVLSLDGQTAWTSSIDTSIDMWDVRSAQKMQTLVGHNLGVVGLALSPGDWLLASASDDGIIRLWDANTGKQLHELVYTAGITTIIFSPDARFMATASTDCAIVLWNTSTGQGQRVLEDHDDKYGEITEITALDFSPDGQTLVSNSSDKTVRLWDVPNGQEIHKFEDVGVFGQLEFDESGSKLILTDEHANNNTMTLDLSPYIPLWQSTPRLHVAHLALRDAWVQHLGRDVLWLPQEYRGGEYGDSWAAREDDIVIGQRSGAVSFFQIRFGDENGKNSRSDQTG